MLTCTCMWNFDEWPVTTSTSNGTQQNILPNVLSELGLCFCYDSEKYHSSISSVLGDGVHSFSAGLSETSKQQWTLGASVRMHHALHLFFAIDHKNVCLASFLCFPNMLVWYTNLLLFIPYKALLSSPSHVVLYLAAGCSSPHHIFIFWSSLTTALNHMFLCEPFFIRQCLS